MGCPQALAEQLAARWWVPSINHPAEVPWQKVMSALRVGWVTSCLLLLWAEDGGGSPARELHPSLGAIQDCCWRGGVPSRWEWVSK